MTDGGWLRRARTFIDERAPPLSMHLLGRLLGVIVMKDLLVHDIPQRLLEVPGRFKLPFSFLFAPPPFTPFTDKAAFVYLVLCFVCGILLMVGRASRLSAALLLSLYAYEFLSDQLTYTNNVLLLLILLALHVLEPVDPARRSAVYPARLAQLVVTTMYVTSALVKLHADWLSGFVLREAFFHYSPVYPRFIAWDSPLAFRIGAILTIPTELFLAVGLWFPRTRKVAIAIGVAFHLAIEVLLPVRMFSYLAIASYVLFVPRTSLAKVVRFRPRGAPWSIALSGIAVALAIDVVFWRVLHVFRLDGRNLAALGIACVVCALGEVVTSRMRGRSVARPSARSFVPRKMRVWLAAAFLVLQLFFAIKPVLGFTKRFAWRMFTEVLVMRVELHLRRGTTWVRTPLYGVETEFRTEVPVYHWDSWSEEEEKLAGYASWVLEQDPSLDGARVIAFYRRDRGPVSTAVFEVKRR